MMESMAVTEAGPRAAYARIEDLFAEQRCVILDGGIATELGRARPDVSPRDGDEALWGTWALVHDPGAVRDVHRAYLDAGCDVISTNTWGLTGELDRQARNAFSTPVHWMDIARRGPRVGREAIEGAGRAGEVALAFSVNGDVDSDARREMLELLPRVFDEDPPDLVLLETMTLVRDGLTFKAVEALVGSGVPVWVSFRRCRHGVCGVFGQHWGGPEGDEFGRAARHFEDVGVRALLVNCLPPDHVPGMLPWLRDFTDLPLGVYPNLGYYTADGWSFDKTVDGAAYADMAAEWRAEGAQIVGGCCGTRPEQIAAARERGRDPPGGPRGGGGGGAPSRSAGAPRSTRPPRRPSPLPAVGRRPTWRPRSRPRRGSTTRAGACSRSTSPRSSASPASSSRPRAATWSGSTCSSSGSAKGCAAWTSGAAPAFSPSSSRATAPSTCTRSTSTAAPWRTRSRTRSATASPTA